MVLLVKVQFRGLEFSKDCFKTDFTYLVFLDLHKEIASCVFFQSFWQQNSWPQSSAIAKPINNIVVIASQHVIGLTM